MDIANFLKITHDKFKKPFCLSIFQSIVRIQNKNNNVSYYTISDLEQDCILYFLKNDRYKKIRNEHGVRISIERYLKDIYKRKSKHHTRTDSYYENFEFIPKEERELLEEKELYNTEMMKIHSVLYHGISAKKLNLNIIKDGKFNNILRIKSYLYLLSKIYDIKNDKILHDIYLYFVEGDKKIKIDKSFYTKRNNGYYTRVDWRVVKYIKDIYIKEVHKIFEKHKL